MVAWENDSDVLGSMSVPFFPDGTYASEQDLYGYPARNNATGRLESLQSYLVTIDFPDTDAAKTFEKDVVDAVLEWDDKFQSDPNIAFRVEIAAERSMEDE
jgi:hypothetical protein